MMERATIELDSATVKPFGSLSGTVRWGSGARPPSLELRVFWMTRGRGTEEVETVVSAAVPLTADGSAAFTIDVPGLPWSFSGQLVSVAWAIELVDDQGEGCALADFVLSPDGRVRELGEVEKPLSVKKRRFGIQSK